MIMIVVEVVVSTVATEVVAAIVMGLQSNESGVEKGDRVGNNNYGTYCGGCGNTDCDEVAVLAWLWMKGKRRKANSKLGIFLEIRSMDCQCVTR